MKPSSETGLYLVDNGACLCDKHLGACAQATGHDISGQRIYPVTFDDVLLHAKQCPDLPALGCETCRYAKTA